MKKDNVLNQPVRLAVLVRWYFLSRGSRAVTVSLLAALIAGFVLAFMRSVQQWLAFVLLINSCFGWMGTLWSCLLWFVLFVPPVFYYSLLKSIPKLWMMPEATRAMKMGFTIGICVLYPLCAALLFYMNDKLITWVSRKECRSRPGTVLTRKQTINIGYESLLASKMFGSSKREG